METSRLYLETGNPNKKPGEKHLVPLSRGSMYENGQLETFYGMEVNTIACMLLLSMLLLKGCKYCIASMLLLKVQDIFSAR